MNQTSKHSDAMDSNLGIFGGSFDPIHLGHVESATHVANELGLSEVRFIPAYVSPHKTTKALTPHATPEQRHTMVEKLCQQNPLFSFDDRELVRGGHSFTLETVQALSRQYPTKTLYLIIGMDSLINFDKWHGYLDILTLCHLVVNTRPNYCIDEVNATIKTLLNNHQETNIATLKQCPAGKIYFTQPNHIDISSTNIRQRLKQQQNCQEYLHPEILEFIHKNKLYR